MPKQKVSNPFNTHKELRTIATVSTVRGRFRLWGSYRLWSRFSLSIFDSFSRFSCRIPFVCSVSMVGSVAPNYQNSDMSENAHLGNIASYLGEDSFRSPCSPALFQPHDFQQNQ